MSYKIKGGKLVRKAADENLTRLYAESFPAAMIFRPGRYPTTARTMREVAHFRYDMIPNAVKCGKPALCYNEAHQIELLTVPDVFAVIRTAEEAHTMVGGFCAECGKKTDAELFDIIRRDLAKLGLGPARDDGHAKVEYQVEIAGITDPIRGIQVAVAGPGDPTDCDPATALIAMLEQDKLPRFAALWRGSHNCHAIVGQLRLDFRELGLDDVFAYKRGSSGLLKGPADPDGWHSWIEADGWAIEVSNGGAGQPILVQRIADFYAARQITGVHDIAMSAD